MQSKCFGKAGNGFKNYIFYYFISFFPDEIDCSFFKIKYASKLKTWYNPITITLIQTVF